MVYLVQKCGTSIWIGSQKERKLQPLILEIKPTMVGQHTLKRLEWVLIKKDSEVFKNLFYGHNVLRPSCYECPYKSVHHPGDITIADYWGIDNASPGFNDNKGVSLVLVNTEKGQEYFEKAKNDVEWRETRIEDSMQHPLIEPEKRPKERDQFWQDFESKDFSYIAKKYGGLTPLWRKAARKAKRLLKGLISK